MVLNYVEGRTAASAALDSAERSQLIAAVIAQVNQEYPAAPLSETEAASRAELEGRVEHILGLLARQAGHSLEEELGQQLRDEILRRVCGLGFLDGLLPPARADISEITLYSRGGGLAVMPKGSVRWSNLAQRVEPHEALRVINLILGEQAKQLSEATPIVSARLPASPHNPGGGRLTAVHPCLAPGEGPCLNLRLYEQRAVQPDWLLARGMLDEALLAFLADQIQAGRRILITGGTRSGKTTLLSALCHFLPAAWRIVLIEDPAEIWIERPEVQQLEARHVPPGVQIQAVSLAQLVDTALRLSPDYLIVGEVRDGAAAMALFRALLTGHAGACTFHAHSPEEAVQRLQTILGADMGVGPRQAGETMAASLDLIVQLAIQREVRRVDRVAALRPGAENGDVQLQTLFAYEPDSPVEAPRWRRLEGGS